MTSSLVAWGKRMESKDITHTIRNAASESQTLRIEYVSASGAPTTRVVDVSWVDGSYYGGYCHLREDVRTFRFDRTRSAALVGAHSKSIQPPQDIRFYGAGDAGPRPGTPVLTSTAHKAYRSHPTRRVASGKQSATRSTSNCYVATCVYGSPTSPEVLVLRRYRDEVLREHKAGQLIVRIYEVIGPRFASRLRERRFLNYMARATMSATVVPYVARRLGLGGALPVNPPRVTHRGGRSAGDGWSMFPQTTSGERKSTHRGAEGLETSDGTARE